MFLCSDSSSLLTLYGLWVNLDAAAARSTVETSAGSEGSEGGEGSGGGSNSGGAMGAQWKGVLVKLMELHAGNDQELCTTMGEHRMVVCC